MPKQIFLGEPEAIIMPISELSKILTHVPNSTIQIQESMYTVAHISKRFVALSWELYSIWSSTVNNYNLLILSSN